jgi:hypothetical protein
MDADTKPGLTCQELAELVTDYFEDALSGQDRARFEEHIDECSMCQDHLAQLRTTLDELGRLTEDDIDPVFFGELQQRFNGWRAIRNGHTSD